MADTKSPGSIAKLHTILVPETVPVSVRKIIYHGAAVDLGGKTVHLSVCYIGPMIYGFYVSGRRERIYQPQKRIDKSDMIPMFARFYGLSDIQLNRIFGSSSRDWPHPVASANVVSLR
jgi:hypothetical protein